MAWFVFKIFVIYIILLLMSGYGKQMNKTCSVALDEYGKSAAEFVHCAIINAHPINLCEMCVKDYMSAVNAYEEILKLQDPSGKACKAKLINMDRLEIIENSFSNMKNMWESGHCSNCFEALNGTMTNTLSNDTVVFKELYDSMKTCVLRHYVNATTYLPSVCNECIDEYTKLNAQYEKIKDTQGEGNVCVDIIDSMNTTRTNWSEILNCSKKEVKSEISLLIAVIIVCLSPVVFYLMTKNLASRVETRLSQQKRLVQTFSFNAPSTSRR